MEALQPARGTRDILGEDQRRHAHVVATARRIAGVYGFDEWSTPIFEDTRVFARTLGDTSDVVTKEMYTFADRGGDSLTLRPEGTAGICRALVTNGLTQSLPQKVFYAGPMFRYERPQKGRYRQFHQIGAELIGPAEPVADAEIIALGWEILGALGLGRGVVLELNTLGDTASRDAYRAALVGYFTDHRAALSPDSRDRLERNPMRILDSKVEGDRALVAGAPTIAPFLTPEAAAFYDGVKRWLEHSACRFVENPRIVRGLDYYSHTAFEFVTTRLGAQGTVMAGGRYDGLVAEMGGPPTPAVGWASGHRAPVHAADRGSVGTPACGGRADGRRGGRGGVGCAAGFAASGGARRDGLSRQFQAKDGAGEPDWRAGGGDPGRQRDFPGGGPGQGFGRRHAGGGGVG